MLIADGISHFKSLSKLADECGVSAAAIINWRKRDPRGLIPELYARRLHDMTGGALRFVHKAYGLPEPVRAHRRKAA